MSRLENGFGDETTTFRDIPNFWYKWLIGVDTGINADEPLAACLHMHSGFPAKMMEQTIVTS